MSTHTHIMYVTVCVSATTHIQCVCEDVHKNISIHIRTLVCVYIYIYACICVYYLHMGSCQNYGPFLGTLNIRCRIIIRTQKGTIILTTTHICMRSCAYWRVWVGFGFRDHESACLPRSKLYCVIVA